VSTYTVEALNEVTLDIDRHTVEVEGSDGNGYYDLMIQVHEVTAGALSQNDFIL